MFFVGFSHLYFCDVVEHFFFWRACAPLLRVRNEKKREKATAQALIPFLSKLRLNHLAYTTICTIKGEMKQVIFLQRDWERAFLIFSQPRWRWMMMIMLYDYYVIRFLSVFLITIITMVFVSCLPFYVCECGCLWRPQTNKTATQNASTFLCYCLICPL